MLSLQHVTVFRGSRVTLRDVCLDMEPADLVCILGEEGSGKTTILKLLTRELQPAEGAIKIDSTFLSQLPRGVLRLYRARIGYVDEEAHLDETRTIAENIASRLDLQGTSVAERDRAVADLIKRFGLAGIASALPSQVSRGERQLTSFARAIATGPLILLLDEPFSGMSDASARLAATLLENMRKRGATIIVTSAEERIAALFHAPRIARLHRGKLTEEEVPKRASTALIRDTAIAATADLVEKTTAVITPISEELPQRVNKNDSKKIRITSVGSI